MTAVLMFWMVSNAQAVRRVIRVVTMYYFHTGIEENVWDFFHSIRKYPSKLLTLTHMIQINMKYLYYEKIIFA